MINLLLAIWTVCVRSQGGALAGPIADKMWTRVAMRVAHDVPLATSTPSALQCDQEGVCASCARACAYRDRGIAIRLFRFRVKYNKWFIVPVS